MEGWIAVHRSMVDWSWYDCVKTKAVFLDFLLYAAHEDRCWHGEKLKRGQLITSVSKQSKRLKMTPKEVRGAWDRLVRTGEITKNGASSYTIITVSNYHRFQHSKKDGGQTKGEQGASEGQAKGDIQQLNNLTIEEGSSQATPIGVQFNAAWGKFGMAKYFGNLARVDGDRLQAIRGLVEYLENNGQTLGDYFKAVLASDFLFEERDGQHKPKHWTSISKLLKLETVGKILEGDYAENFEKSSPTDSSEDTRFQHASYNPLDDMRNYDCDDEGNIGGYIGPVVPGYHSREEEGTLKRIHKERGYTYDEKGRRTVPQPSPSGLSQG